MGISGLSVSFNRGVYLFSRFLVANLSVYFHLYNLDYAENNHPQKSQENNN